MNRRTLARLAGALVAVAAGVVPLTVAPPAHAGQVGITLGIKGAGYVQVVEGSLEDGSSINCDKTANRDHRVTLECPRIRNEEPFEAWVWLRPLTVYIPSTWEFAGWSGCDQTRVRNERTECGLSSPAFGSVEKYPVASFRDTEAPEVTNLDATQGASQGSFEFTWQTRGASLTECRIVGQPYEVCSSPTRWVLSEGVHEFQVRAQDQSGNVSNTPVVEVVNVDTMWWSKPSHRTSERTASFSWTTGSATSYACALDGVAIACTTQGWLRLDNLGEGWHTFTVQGRHGGWADPTPSRWDWLVDSIAPDTLLGGGPAEGSSTSSTTAEFTLASDEPGAGFGCSLDGKPIACSAGTLRLDSLTPGEHSLTVTASDSVGNVDKSAATRFWTVDTTAPSTTLTGGPANGSVLPSTATSFRLGSNESGGAMTCTLDAEPRACAPGALTLTGLTPGTHDLRVRAADRDRKSVV